MLDNSQIREQAFPTVAHSAVGFGDPDYLAHSRAVQRGFSVRAWFCSYERAVWETLKGLPVPSTGSPTCAVPLSRLATRKREIKPVTWSSNMSTASQGDSPSSTQNPSTETLTKAAAIADAARCLLDLAVLLPSAENTSTERLGLAAHMLRDAAELIAPTASPGEGQINAPRISP